MTKKVGVIKFFDPSKKGFGYVLEIPGGENWTLNADDFDDATKTQLQINNVIEFEIVAAPFVDDLDPSKNRPKAKKVANPIKIKTVQSGDPESWEYIYLSTPQPRGNEEHRQIAINALTAAGKAIPNVSGVSTSHVVTPAAPVVVGPEAPVVVAPAVPEFDPAEPFICFISANPIGGDEATAWGFTVGIKNQQNKPLPDLKFKVLGNGELHKGELTTEADGTQHFHAEVASDSYMQVIVDSGMATPNIEVTGPETIKYTSSSFGWPSIIYGAVFGFFTLGMIASFIIRISQSWAWMKTPFRERQLQIAQGIPEEIAWLPFAAWGSFFIWLIFWAVLLLILLVILTPRSAKTLARTGEKVINYVKATRKPFNIKVVRRGPDGDGPLYYYNGKQIDQPKSVEQKVAEVARTGFDHMLPSIIGDQGLELAGKFLWKIGKGIFGKK